MQTDDVILKIENPCARSGRLIDRIFGELDAKNFAKLMDVADLRANPRDCKVGGITDAIIESLEDTPQLFEHKTKGLLLSCSRCEKLDRNRWRLHFSDHDIEGILDGGHNLLAIARYIIFFSVENGAKLLKKAKTLEDLQPVWIENREEIQGMLEDFDFLVPVEINYAKDSEGGIDDFMGSALEIAQARNNNKELAEEAKANKAGHYDFLKECLDPNIASQVEWRTNSGGRLKVREIVAMSTIPLSRVQADIDAIRKLNPVSIYRNKGMCVQHFNEIMETPGVCSVTNGAVKVLEDAEVKSALALMIDMPRIFDWIYCNFPDYYNGVSSRFGGITSVRFYDPNVQNPQKDKHLKKAPVTRFYQQECVYDYPDGFIMPLLWSTSELISSHNGIVQWDKDPIEFLEHHLDEIMQTYVGVIQMVNYNPQGVGKAPAAYSMLSSLVRGLL